jgi:serine/threonine protein kinase
MSQDALAPGTVLKGRFTITRLIGGGGMARVYQIEERRADGSAQTWAMKELRLDSQDAKAEAEAYQLFEQEAHLLAGLDHPHLPDVCAFFSENKRSYLVMEFIPGESLKKRLETANAPILESQVLDWAIQICDVLDYLHTQNPPVIFRDMKPSNIMVTPDGAIKLIDFGIQARQDERYPGDGVGELRRAGAMGQSAKRRAHRSLCPRRDHVSPADQCAADARFCASDFAANSGV